MIRRGVSLLLLCASVFAQWLPPSQGPMPRASGEPERHSTTARVDAIVTDLQGRSIPGLTAADFTLETGGKPRTIASCEFRADEPLRLVVLLDDLSLTLEQSNAARRALRAFVEHGLGPGDEMAVLRSSEGAGAIDRLSADKREIGAGIDRAHYNPLAGSAAAEAFRAATVTVLRAVLEGLRELPGRKAVLLISTSVRETTHVQLARQAHRAAAAVYGVSMAARNPAVLDMGAAELAKATAGTVVDGGDVAGALARAAADQSGYYVLSFDAADAGYDYIAGAPRVEGVLLRTVRPGATVRARDGLFGTSEGGDAYRDVEREFERAIGSELIHNGIHARVTPLLSVGTTPQIESVVQLDGRDVTFVKTVDGRYHASIETAIALYDESGEAVKDAVRNFEATLNELGFEQFQRKGLNYTVSLTPPKEGAYQVRVVVRDARTGRMGSARHFLPAAGWKDGKLAMSSIVLHGEMENNEVKDPEEIGAVRRFGRGHTITYTFNLFHVGANEAKAGAVTTRSEIWRDGVQVFAGEPKTIELPASASPGARSIAGQIALKPQMPPGTYYFKVEVTDRIVPRTVTQWMDFEVRP